MAWAIIFFFMGTALFADGAQDARTAVEKELVAIMFFANEQVMELEQEYQELSEDILEYQDLDLEILKDDLAQYQKIAKLADRRLKQMEQGLSLWWSTNYLQLLRNHLYSLHSDTDELIDHGIKRRSQSLLSSGIELVSNSASILIKCAGTIAAIRTIYQMLPASGTASSELLLP